MGAEWHNPGLKYASITFGWLSFAIWTVSFYPQAILNWKRKSVVGLNFDFMALNITKHSTYLTYNCFFTLSTAMRAQYRQKYGADAIIPVTPSDLAFSIHAVALTLFQIGQCLYYPREGQTVSRGGMILTSCAWVIVIVAVSYAVPDHRWLWLASALGLVQDVLTAIKYMPQAYMNARRRSTEGWSLANVVMDASGGLCVFIQMALQSIDAGNCNNFKGGYGKLILSLETMAFDMLFIVQHFCLYPASRRPKQAGIVSGLIEEGDGKASGPRQALLLDVE